MHTYIFEPKLCELRWVSVQTQNIIEVIARVVRQQIAHGRPAGLQDTDEPLAVWSGGPEEPQGGDQRVDQQRPVSVGRQQRRGLNAAAGQSTGTADGTLEPALTSSSDTT